MGQKVHPGVFKLSRTAGWNSKYHEKKSTSLYSSIHKDVEVTGFIKQFFKRVGLNIHTCKLNYLTHKINIFASYTKTYNLVEGASTHGEKKASRLKKIKKREAFNGSVPREFTKKAFLVFLNDLQGIQDALFGAIVLDDKSNALSSFEKFKEMAKVYATFLKLLDVKKIQSLELLLPLPIFKYLYIMNLSRKSDSRKKDFVNFFFVKIFKSSVKKTLERAMQNYKLLKGKKARTSNYSFLNLFFKVFSFFFKKTLKITLIFKFLNKKFKNNRKTKRDLKKRIITSLRKFTRNTFFKPGVNLMFLIGEQKESAEMISTFISTSIKNFKKHKLFLKFIKKSLYALAKRKKGVIKAVAVQLKGRINGNDRARSYVVSFKKLPTVLQIGSRINYSETTAFTPDGTLSVKVWVEYCKSRYPGPHTIKLCKPRHKKSSIKKQKKVNLLN